jgi:hypothetical protein
VSRGPFAYASSILIGVAGVAAFAAVVWSCMIYDGSLLLPAAPPAEEAAPPPDAGGPGPSCPLATWPRKPAADDPSVGPDRTFVLALRSIDYGLGRDGGVPRDFGFDLDGVCTCEAKTQSGDSCVAFNDAGPHCDLDEGRDSMVTELLVLFNQVYKNAVSQEEVNDSLRKGLYGFLVRVSGYNGTANDTRVEVAVYNSPGNEGVQDGGFPKPPLEDGTDRWTVDPLSLLSGSGAPDYPPVYVDDTAYVANRRLVASLDFPVTFASVVNGTAAITVDLKGSVVVGTLVPDGNSWRVDDGTLTGRWPSSSLLTALEVLPEPAPSTAFLCGDGGVYRNIVQPLICNGQDIATLSRDDRLGQPCDAISLSLGFTARPAQLGDVVVPSPKPRPCGVDWRAQCDRR